MPSTSFSEPPPLLVFMGPTASGKTALAIRAAEAVGGEVVSVDSMQLYRGLEIGTAQPTMEERHGIPHHLIGVFDFHDRIDVFRFQKLAEETIAGILARGKRPVLAGGTGLYLHALLYGIDDLPADRELRAKLDAEFDAPEREESLHRRMAELDPAALERWGRCRRRLIRAMEVRMLTGKSLLELQRNPGNRLRRNVRAWKLETPPELLRERIARRTAQMLRDGWIDEAREAIRNGLLESPTAHQAIGYRLIGEFLAGRLRRDELETRIVNATRQLARRQRTWFRHRHPEAIPLPMPENDRFVPR